MATVRPIGASSMVEHSSSDTGTRVRFPVPPVDSWHSHAKPREATNAGWVTTPVIQVNGRLVTVESGRAPCYKVYKTEEQPASALRVSPYGQLGGWGDRALVKMMTCDGKQRALYCGRRWGNNSRGRRLNATKRGETMKPPKVWSNKQRSMCIFAQRTCLPYATQISDIKLQFFSR